jgi:hypothetical protein
MKTLYDKVVIPAGLSGRFGMQAAIRLAAPASEELTA